MEGISLPGNSQDYPILFMPKKHTVMHPDTENGFIELTMFSRDAEGNNMCIYSGHCHIALTDDTESISNSEPSDEINTEQIPIIFVDDDKQSQQYNQSVWIDPARSPFVQFHNDTEPDLRPSLNNHITVEQHNTYITQNIYHQEPSCSMTEEFEHKKFKKVQNNDTGNNCYEQSNFNMYEEDELECSMVLCQLPEEIWNEENRLREQRKMQDIQDENVALKQLMSLDKQQHPKPHKTILYYNNDFGSGTIQNIFNPSSDCFRLSETISSPDTVETQKENKKKYRCENCAQIFDDLKSFRQHNKSDGQTKGTIENKVLFKCGDCGKLLKSRAKLDYHQMGHDDPERECSKCHKVFSSKSGLRNHRKTHYRKYQCDICPKSFTSESSLKRHYTKTHSVFICKLCNFTTNQLSELKEHQDAHVVVYSDITESASESAYDDDIIVIPSTSKTHSDVSDANIEEQGTDADGALDVVATILANEMFLMPLQRTRKHTYKDRKVCDICFKTFTRISDLKRHMIEHLVRYTLSTNPVDPQGVLNIRCVLCQAETFHKIDLYKAHLREHAKLTIYKCAKCNKSFSDSSNFSKHKKVHSARYFQCDMCLRKFNSKKSITHHMDYHYKNAPIKCSYCHKIFHYESTLKRHIKVSHSTKKTTFRCKFCETYHKSLKAKWDHEWEVHRSRKMIVDCWYCNSKFRKFSELRAHCLNAHGPKARKMLTNKRKK